MKAIIADVIGFVFLAVALALLMALPVYYLWNALMPEIFGLTTVTFWQALSISLLSACLFAHRSSTSSS